MGSRRSKDQAYSGHISAGEALSSETALAGSTRITCNNISYHEEANKAQLRQHHKDRKVEAL